MSGGSRGGNLNLPVVHLNVASAYIRKHNLCMYRRVREVDVKSMANAVID